MKNQVQTVPELITIAICTWNRAAILDRTLESFQSLRIPDGVDWELLLVDNNCTDETPEVARRHAAHLPLRLLVEPVQGVGIARNRAISAARGEYLLFTDDDVLVDPSWVASYVEAFRQWAAAAFFGGTIDPCFDAGPPPWFEHLDIFHKAVLFGQNRLGDTVRALRPGEVPYGANMAFRRATLSNQRFSGRFGRTKQEMILAGETELLGRLMRKGLLGVWVGPARVRHCIPQENATLEYVERRMRGFGRTRVRLGELGFARFLGGSRNPAAVAYWKARAWMAGIRAGRRGLAGGSEWVRAIGIAAMYNGMIEEVRSQDGNQ